ncbi:unnamed protein product [Rotaria socialis]|uniref:Uncharacterized protein n=1 Tax=Rotaria socialis TaxID=392032 RepID=A0A820RWY1_9BILA|nr:unnamed protein product [Rotaria socialis]
MERQLLGRYECLNHKGLQLIVDAFFKAVICFLALMKIWSRVNAAAIPNSCPLPPQLKAKYDFNWKLKNGEKQNLIAKVAYLKLVLSWSPTYCESLSAANRNKQFQCRNSDSFGLIVHGLWPQAAKPASIDDHPRNCQDDKQLNATLVKRFYCMMPDEYLMQAEWEKHGSCHYATANDYLTTIENFYRSLNIPNIRSMKNSTQAKIRSAFLQSNPKLFSSAIQISMNPPNRLKEVKICYDLKNQLKNCNS